MRARIGEILKSRGLLDDFQIRSALGYQRQWGCRIGQALLGLQLVDERELFAAIGGQLGVPVVRIGSRDVSPRVLRLVPEKVVRRHRVMPLEIVHLQATTSLLAAFQSPGDLSLVDQVSFAAGLRVQPVLAADDDIDQAIARHFGGPRVDPLPLSPDPRREMRLVHA
jgi:hypothetical protein